MTQAKKRIGSGIAASIEISARQAIESADLPDLLPRGVRVYVADIGTDSLEALVAASRHLRDLGYTPVPHFASRGLTTKAALEERVRAMAEEAGVCDVLVIGGGPKKPAGPFSSTMEVLEMGYFDKYGIREIGVAGHPEGNPDFSEDVAIEALRLKQAFSERTGAKVRIVTQFGFHAEKFISWAEGLRECGIDLPIHLGVAGPATVPTLIKYAAMCGVGNSLDFLRKQTRSLATLAICHSPESIVGPIEIHLRRHPGSLIAQIHVFPFGGIKRAAEWLADRGTWDRGLLQGEDQRVKSG